MSIRDTTEVSGCVQATTAGAASEGGAEGARPEGSQEEEGLTRGDSGGEGQTPTDTTPQDQLRRAASEARHCQ